MARIELSKYLPDDIVFEIQSKLLPDETFIYDFLYELLNIVHNTKNIKHCLICNTSSCIHCFEMYATSYNFLRIASGIQGLCYAT
jgi:hypothetical protein